MTYSWRIATLVFFGSIGAIAIASLIASSKPGVMDIIGAVLFLFTLSLPVVFVWKWHRSVEIHLHQNGIARKSFSKTTALSWDQVLYVKYRAVRQKIHGVSVGTSYHVTIIGTGQQKIKLNNNIKNGAQVINLVLDKITAVQVPRFTQLMAEGKEIPFGNLFLSQQGVRKGKATAAWKDIGTFQLEGGYVKIKLRNKWLSFCSVQFASIPNGHAFVRLCQNKIAASGAVATA